jgi:hypothetical protein
LLGVLVENSAWSIKAVVDRRASNRGFGAWIDAARLIRACLDLVAEDVPSDGDVTLAPARPRRL